MGSVSLILGDETGRCRNRRVADKKIRIQMKRGEISRTGRGAGAWCRTCCYWFCVANGAGNELDGSIGKSGFWAIIERKMTDFCVVCSGPFAGKPRSYGLAGFTHFVIDTQPVGARLGLGGIPTKGP
jgi:hypothetical protein